MARSLAVANRVTDDAWLQHKVLGMALKQLAETEREVTPAEVTCDLVQSLSKTLGSADPFQKERDDWFAELEAIIPDVRRVIANSTSPIVAAATAAARANIFDDERASPGKIREELHRIGFKSPDEPSTDELAVSDWEDFAKDLSEAKDLLFAPDSGPELFFDRLFIEELVKVNPSLQITCVVRSTRTLLDANQEDADRAELAKWPGVVEVVDPGATVIGLPVNDCSREFRERYESADLVLAKGQAHFETLSDLEIRAYFLLRVKCEVFARHQGTRVGDAVLLRS